jgi:hypothetical protein
MFEKNERKGKYSEEDAAYLVSVVDNTEADRLTAALNDAHIPVLRKYSEAGSAITVIMGDSVFGVDLYVPAELYEKAKEIIEVVNGNIISETDENNLNADNTEEDETEEEELKKSKKIKTFFGDYYLSDLIIYGVCGAIVIFCLINLIFRFI